MVMTGQIQAKHDELGTLITLCCCSLFTSFSIWFIYKLINIIVALECI